MGRKPKHTGKPMTERFMMRVDQEFLDLLNELRTFYPGVPGKAEAIRKAVITALEVEKRERKGKK